MHPEKLIEYHQFVNWSYLPDKNGELQKVPIDLATLLPVNAHNSANWMSYDKASALSGNVAFVLSDDDPFWCLDIDHCINPTTGSIDERVKLWAHDRFSGAYVETSTSGEGIHIWGCGDPPLNHKCRFDNVEFYTRLRAMALGTPISGNIWLDWTKALKQHIPEKPTNESSFSGEVDDTLHPDAVPPETDTRLMELLFRENMLNQALYEGNSEILGARYLKQKDSIKCGFDHSAARLALLGKLAFYTGNNRARMQHLFLQSPLVQRWQHWPQHLRLKELNRACGSTVYSRGGVQGQSEGLEAPRVESATWSNNEVTDKGVIMSGRAWLTNEIYPNRLSEFFDDFRLMTESGKVLEVSTGNVYNRTTFNDSFNTNGFVFILSVNPRKVTDKPFEAFSRTPLPSHKAMYADLQPLTISGSISKRDNISYCNVYQRPAMVKGDVTKFLNLVSTLYVKDQDMLLDYMAHVIQHPDVKMGWVPILQGPEGCGKSIILTVLRRCVGAKYSTPIANEQLGEDKNGWIENILVGTVDEFKIDDPKALSRLMNYIGDPEIQLRAMYQDARAIKNSVNFLLATNHKNSVKINTNSRRWAPLFARVQTFNEMLDAGLNANYYVALGAWLQDTGYSNINYYLMNRDVPNLDITRAPRTSSTPLAIIESYTSFQRAVMDAIDCKQLGFTDGVIVSHELRRLVNESTGKPVCPYLTTKPLEMLGYRLHPSLLNGRANNKLKLDGSLGVSAPTLYFKIGHQLLAVTDASVISTRVETIWQSALDETSNVVYPKF